MIGILLNKETIVTIQYLHSYKQNPFKSAAPMGFLLSGLCFLTVSAAVRRLPNSYKPSIKIFCGTAHNIMFML